MSKSLPVFAWFGANLDLSGFAMDTFWTLCDASPNPGTKFSTRDFVVELLKATVFQTEKTAALIASGAEKSYDYLDVFDFGEMAERLKAAVC